jgi:hypothetical protein
VILSCIISKGMQIGWNLLEVLELSLHNAKPESRYDLLDTSVQVTGAGVSAIRRFNTAGNLTLQMRSIKYLLEFPRYVFCLNLNIWIIVLSKQT